MKVGAASRFVRRATAGDTGAGDPAWLPLRTVVGMRFRVPPASYFACGGIRLIGVKGVRVDEPSGEFEVGDDWDWPIAFSTPNEN